MFGLTVFLSSAHAMTDVDPPKSVAAAVATKRANQTWESNGSRLVSCPMGREYNWKSLLVPIVAVAATTRVGSERADTPRIHMLGDVCNNSMEWSVRHRNQFILLMFVTP